MQPPWLKGIADQCPLKEPENPENKEASYDTRRNAGKSDTDFRPGFTVKPGGSCGRARKTGTER